MDMLSCPARHSVSPLQTASKLDMVYRLVYNDYMNSSAMRAYAIYPILRWVVCVSPHSYSPLVRNYVSQAYGL